MAELKPCRGRSRAERTGEAEMTTEQAINEIVSSGYGQVQCHEETMRMAVDDLRAQQERENPKPLTVEELRKMDGQPVWVEFNSNFTRTHVDPCWMIVYEKENMLQTAYEFVDFGDTGWLAYRYPPKGADAK